MVEMAPSQPKKQVLCLFVDSLNIPAELVQHLLKPIEYRKSNGPSVTGLGHVMTYTFHWFFWKDIKLLCKFSLATLLERVHQKAL